MKNKGFTLIELLAVIVILAIIALIAVPIIINIVNDSRESSYKRSVELYGKAVENAIAKAQLDGTAVASGDLSSAFLSTVQYDGAEVSCATNKLNEDGSIYLAGCSVRGHAVEYTYGTEPSGTSQATEPEDKYAYLTYTGSDVDGPSIGGDASSLSPNAPTDNNYYLKFKLNDNNEVTKSEACIRFGGEEYCVEGGGYDETIEYSPYYGWDTDAAHSTGNVKKLYDIQQDGISGVSCDFNSQESNCRAGSAGLEAGLDGYVSTHVGPGYCNVGDNYSSSCGSL